MGPEVKAYFQPLVLGPSPVSVYIVSVIILTTRGENDTAFENGKVEKMDE
jgi:hypothetical protein